MRRKKLGNVGSLNHIRVTRHPAAIQSCNGEPTIAVENILRRLSSVRVIVELIAHLAQCTEILVSQVKYRLSENTKIIGKRVIEPAF